MTRLFPGSSEADRLTDDLNDIGAEVLELLSLKELAKSPKPPEVVTSVLDQRKASADSVVRTMDWLN
ncbi:hypothetical protein IT412_03510 [Candidatus Peregrinibacteria bacterium]|nr:hypothetical protein [Candidatus Peregrinibacteria bacterium]